MEVLGEDEPELAGTEDDDPGCSLLSPRSLYVAPYGLAASQSPGVGGDEL